VNNIHKAVLIFWIKKMRKEEWREESPDLVEN